MKEIEFFKFEHSSKLIEELLQDAKRVLTSNSYILGQEVLNFEKEWANYIGAAYSVGVSNATDGLILALKVLDINPGDQVILPSNSYLAPVLAVIHVGASPIFVEPNKDTFNLDGDSLYNFSTNNTKAIIPIHLYGQACSMNEIQTFANTNDIMIVEDYAQAHGAKYNHQIVGSFGNVNVTSFYPTKNLGAFGDAGMITTNDKEIAEKLYQLRNYGTNTKYIAEHQGYNSRMCEIQAAFLKRKLLYLNSINDKKQRIARQYNELLSQIDEIQIPNIAQNVNSVYHQYVILANKRNQLQSYLQSNNIQTNIHYPVPPHLQPAFSFLKYKKGDFPIAEYLAAHSLSLPIYSQLNQNEISFIASKIKDFYVQT